MDTEKTIMAAIASQVAKDVERVTSEEIAAAQKRIETRVRERSAQIAANVVSYFEMESMGRHELRLTVRFPVEGSR